jgi:ABC-type Mn2+/Zn2+ transport system ATPase subunit
VTARGVTLGYRGRVLFRDLSFDIERGAIVGIVGPNGSGKTTLLRTILGLLPPLRGQLRRDPNLTVSYVPQRERLDTILPLTALDVVLLGRSARAGALSRRSRADYEAAGRARWRRSMPKRSPLSAFEACRADSNSGFCWHGRSW